MNRKQFIRTFSLMSTAIALSKYSMSTSFLKNLPNTGVKMPVLFVGHGNPMNAIQDNKYTQGWFHATKDIPKPKAIVCVSAHWETNGTKVFSAPSNRMIYDMYGFPKQLYEVQYPSPGDPELAQYVKELVTKTQVSLDETWGLDHGAWSVLVKMYPDATIPCFQLSLDKTRNLQHHYEVAKELAALRNKGVLIIGSGNIVHNLRYAKFGDVPPYDWAVEFDEKIKSLINNRDHTSIIDYKKLGESAILSVNSAEHYIPLLYVLALQEKEDQITHFNEGIDFGSGSMRCVKIG